MTITEFFQLLFRHLLLILGLAFGMAILVFFMTRDYREQFTSKALIDTGLISGYSLESRESGERVDREFLRSEMESMASLATAYQMVEELATRLLAQYLSKPEPGPQWISEENAGELHLLFPDDWLEKLGAGGSADDIYARLMRYRNARQANPVSELLYSDHVFFGLNHLRQALKVERKGATDLLEFSYTTEDPGVCLQTLRLLILSFMERQVEIQDSQSSGVLSFFKSATDTALGRLQLAEDRLLAFHEENNIINYYEQTRFIANKKEDLDELFFRENMQFRSAQAVQRQLEEQLKGRIRLSKLNADLLEKRQELASVSEQLARAELLDLGSTQAQPRPQERAQLQTRFEQLREEMSGYAQEKYGIDMSPEGIRRDELLDEWLKILIDTEQTGARIKAITERREEFDDIYSRFAPWGSRLKRIEREISLAENAYLENLHSYNQARLHLQNNLLSAQLQVVDAPFFPTEGRSSKRSLLIVAAFAAGLVLSVGSLIALELFDPSLKRPSSATRQTGFELAGVFPRLPAPGKKGRVRAAGVQHRAVELLLQHLKLATRHRKEGPRRIVVLSTRAGEGKSLVARLAADRLRAYGERVLYLYPEGSGQAARAPADEYAYAVDAGFFEKQHLRDLMANKVIPIGEFRYVFLELPPLLDGQYPIDLVAKADLSLLVCRANRVWNNADKSALETYQKATGKEPRLALNGVSLQALEEWTVVQPRQEKRTLWLKPGHSPG